MTEIILAKTSALLLLPERTYGTIKRVGMFNSEPILYGDINQVKPGSLYYMPSVKLVYRYVKPVFRKTQNQAPPIGVQIGGGSLPGHPAYTITEEYHFTTIEPTSTEGLFIPEEEKGKIKNAGYLFNEIIYSGDPNLIENGSLFYHKTLPYISIVSNIEGTISLSTKEIDEKGNVITDITEYKVNEEDTPLDYPDRYFTIEVLGVVNGSGSIRVTTNYSIYYAPESNNPQWTYLENGGDIEVSVGDKIMFKDYSKGGNMFEPFNFTTITSFNAYGNILSLVDGDNFRGVTSFSDLTATLSRAAQIFMMFFSGTPIVSAENLILPITEFRNSDSQCYDNMFESCSHLTTAPQLPATTLTNGCYNGMFTDCTSLTTAPVLPAITLVESCYKYMFSGCSSLNYIKALFTGPEEIDACLGHWVTGVSSKGTFVENPEASWDAKHLGLPKLWTVTTEDA